MFVGSALSAAGELDSSFNGDGRVITDLGADEGASGLAVQSDGKIVVVGASFLVRYDATGELDATLDEDGILPMEGLALADVEIQEDGKLVVAGSTPGLELFVARLNADGTPDVSFSDDGMATAPEFGGYGGELALQPDGKIVVVGTSYREGEGGNAAVVRFATDGTPDSSFGMRFVFPGAYSFANAVDIDAGGKIVIGGGDLTIRKGTRFALARLNEDGTRDNSFGGDGVVRTMFGSHRDAAVFDVAIQADGKIVAAGRAYAGGSRDADFALARFTSSGRLDTAFSDDGKVRTDFNGGRDGILGLVIQANGRLVAAGSAARAGHRLQTVFALARYRMGGRLDRTFSGDGKTTTRFGSNRKDFGNDAASQTDGRLVVVGTVSPFEGEFDFGVARYLAD